MLIAEMAQDQRPREKMKSMGAHFLSDVELLAIVLGKGCQGKNVLELAQEVLAQIASDESISLEQLSSIKGVGFSKACQILASIEFSKRFMTPLHRIQIRTPADALPALCQLKHSAQEEFVVLTLDGAHQLIKQHTITIGLINQSQIHPRETFYPAIQDRAVSILVAHNHPSGNREPSQADLDVTQKLVAAGKTLGISLLDHLIITRNGYLSIREQYARYFNE